MESFTDNRGTLYFPIKKNDFHTKECTISINKKNVFRGIHVNNFKKLVTCIQGSIKDFVINLETKEVDEYSLFAGDQILIRPNFGHSFLSMEDNTIVVYHFSESFGETKQIHHSEYLNLPDYVIMSEKDSKK